MAMNVNAHSHEDNNSATNINTTTTDETTAHNVNNLASASNSSPQKQEKSGKSEGGRNKMAKEHHACAFQEGHASSVRDNFPRPTTYL